MTLEPLLWLHRNSGPEPGKHSLKCLRISQNNQVIVFVNEKALHVLHGREYMVATLVAIRDERRCF